MNEADLISRDLIHIVKNRARQESKQDTKRLKQVISNLQKENRELRVIAKEYRTLRARFDATNKVERALLSRYSTLQKRMNTKVSFTLKELFKLQEFQWWREEGRALRAIQRRAR